MQPAIIVIDMLNDFFDKDKNLQSKKIELCNAINELVNIGRKKHIPIIWVRQEFKQDLSDAFLEMKRKNQSITIGGTKGCQILDELEVNKDDKIIVKKRYSAFFKTSLNEILRKLKIDTLILAGINTHACIRTAAIDAYQNDYEVIIAKECVNSWDKKHHEITLEYLKGSMGMLILSNNQIKRKFS